MNLKYTLLLLISLSLSYCASGQKGVKSYENDYLQLDYPEDWNLSGRPTSIKIKIPDPAYDTSYKDASLKIGIKNSTTMAPPIIESMKDDLEILKYEAMDEHVANMKYSSVVIDEEVGFLINKSDDKRSYYKYVFLLEDALTLVTIWIEMGKDSYPEFESKINQIVTSIKFKDRSKETKRVLVETTEKEFTMDWVSQKAQFSGALSKYEITKLDSFLFNLKAPTYGFKITDLGIEINTWADFFAWKPETALKDYQLFAFQDWGEESLRIFNMYMHLGAYDKLRIEEMPDNQLKFLFSKENGHSIRWRMEYIENHQFPLDEDIALDRFIYSMTQTYRRAKDGKSAYMIPFLINNKVYRMKVENLSVY